MPAAAVLDLHPRTTSTRRLVLGSSGGTVYGAATQLPTRRGVARPEPISLHGHNALTDRALRDVLRRAAMGSSRRSSATRTRTGRASWRAGGRESWLPPGVEALARRGDDHGLRCGRRASRLRQRGRHGGDCVAGMNAEGPTIHNVGSGRISLAGRSARARAGGRRTQGGHADDRGAARGRARDATRLFADTEQSSAGRPPLHSTQEYAPPGIGPSSSRMSGERRLPSGRPSPPASRSHQRNSAGCRTS